LVLNYFYYPIIVSYVIRYVKWNCYILSCYFVTVLRGFVTWVCNIMNGSSKRLCGLFCMYCYNVTEYNIIYNTPHSENFALAEGVVKGLKNIKISIYTSVTL
jgi:hypothetical protein